MQSSNLCRFWALSLFPAHCVLGKCYPCSSLGHQQPFLVPACLPGGSVGDLGCLSQPALSHAVSQAALNTRSRSCPSSEMIILNYCSVMLLGGQYFTTDYCKMIQIFEYFIYFTLILQKWGWNGKLGYILDEKSEKYNRKMWDNWRQWM